MMEPMPLDIRPAAHDDLADALPLFAAYQRFYTGEAQPDERNRAFLARFLPGGDAGLLLLAREAESREPLGLANLYWTFSSTTAREHALLNDLFVAEHARGRDVGHALIEAAAGVARDRGLAHLSWQTAVDNRRAQRLYERFDAERTIWFEYEIETVDANAAADSPPGSDHSPFA